MESERIWFLAHTDEPLSTRGVYLLSTGDLPKEKWQPRDEGILPSSYGKLEKRLAGGKVMRIFHREDARVFETLKTIPYGDSNLLTAVASIMCEHIGLESSETY